MNRLFSLMVLLAAGFVFVACSHPEDAALSKVYTKESRGWALQQLTQLAQENKIERPEKVATKLLNLNKTPDIGAAVLVVGAMKYAPAIPRIREIADDCFQTQSTRNLKTLESIATALGEIGNPDAIPILEKYFTLNTPEKLAQGQREKPESVAKRAAIEALSKFPPNLTKSAVPQIIKVLESPKEDFGTKYTIAGLLGKFGDPIAIKPLIAALFYEEQGFSLFTQARESLIALRKFPADETELIKAYSMQNATVNDMLAKNRERALEQICPEYKGNPEAEKKGECPKDADYRAALASIDAALKIKTSMVLADIRSKKIVPILIAEITNQLAREDKQPFLAEHLAIQLARCGDFAATDVLLKMVSSDFAKEKSKQKKALSKEEQSAAKLAARGTEISIRMKGAEALGILGNPAALPYLLKAAKEPTIKEYNVNNELIFLYEAQIWASDAYSRMIGDPAGAAEFIEFAQKFITDGNAYAEKVKSKAKEKVLKDLAGKQDNDLDKKVDSEAKLDVNYESTVRSVSLMERFLKRAQLTVSKCNEDIACYAGALSDPDAVNVEKAVYMVGYANKLTQYLPQLKPVFFHKEPFVRDALVIALYKTEDNAFVPVLEDVIAKEGDKVEYAASSKEFKAMLSFLEAFGG